MGPTSRGTALLLWLLAAVALATAANARIRRAVRETRGTESLLTVEWEGIQTGDHPDSDVKGFLVEYRSETERHWMVHSGIIPYKGPNHQYRVQIPRLPTGISYFVRIKVLGENNDVLVETPEIRARTELVSIRCANDEISAPRHLEVTHDGQYSLAIKWDAPDCGSIGEYQVEVSGVTAPFDVHRQTVTHPHVSVTNLLPGTIYNVRIRAADRSRQVGPWNAEVLQAKTKGDELSVSSDMHVTYVTDSEIRVSWDPLDSERIQHYEVVAVEQGSDPSQVERVRVSSLVNSFVLTGLRPNKRYLIGVVAFVDHEPNRVYRAEATTSETFTEERWEQKPDVMDQGGQHYTIHWKRPPTDVHKFVVEFRLPNETHWRAVEEQVADDQTGDYHVRMPLLEGVTFYSVRLTSIDRNNQVVSRTEEMTVGEAVENSCHAPAGIPLNVRAVVVDSTKIRYEWNKPNCDEGVAPIDGYEYIMHESGHHPSHDTPSYIGGAGITMQDLIPNKKYSFRVRTRSGNGHSPWSHVVHTETHLMDEDCLTPHNRSKRQAKHLITDDRNFYKLRIVLSPPDFFLVWTPLPQHANNIQRFQLSYKERTADKWTRVSGRPEDFSCPPGVADSEDYCFRLKNFFFAVRYMSSISYTLTNGDTAPRGSQLHFSLVQLELDAGVDPLDVVLRARGSSVLVHWSPLFPQRVLTYQVSLLDSRNRVQVVHSLSGQSRSVTLSLLSSAFHSIVIYAFLCDLTIVQRISLQLHPHLQAGLNQPYSSLSLSQPRIEQHGSRTVVHWTAEGDASGVHGFQIDVRADGEREWRESGGMIRSEPSQSHYRHALGALPVASYFLRVRAIDGTMSTVSTSTSTNFAVSCQTPLSPDNVRLDRVSDNAVRISWVYPQEDQACQTYFFISGSQNGKQIHHRLAGNERSFDIDGAAQGDWRVEVRAVNSAGSGPASRQAVFTSAQQSLVSAPKVSVRGNDLHVSWRSEGDGRGVFGYRIQYRKPNSGWIPYGQLVPYVGDNQEYTQLLTGLEQGQQYSVHIQVLDRNSYVMYISPEANTKSSCHAPSQAPSHLQLEAPDSSHVKASWALPPQSSWGCADLQFEIHVDEPRGVAPAIVDGHHINHVFPSAPNQNWVVRLRSKNSAGHSAWTPASQARTPPGGELIVGPNVAYRQGRPIISWNSKENVGDLIEQYILEWKPAQESQWREHGQPIPFSGWQRPYSVDLGELPKGHVYQVRVVAKDPNRGTAYTSPVVSVQTQSDCQAPRRPPTNLQVAPLGPTQIRLTWAPLHESEWNCERLWYIVKYSTPKNQGFKNLTSGENTVVLESDPYTRWTFEVQAANPAGETQWSRTETAQTQDAAPGPISDLRVQPVGSDSLQVSWRPPTNPNGQITGYEVTYQLISRGMCENVNEAPRTVTTTGPHHVLTGLHPHSRYRVGVAAKTTFAGERVSQEVQTDQTTPTAAPSYLRVDETRPNDVSISWQAPPCLQTNGEITEYEYEVTPADRRSNVQKSSNNIRGNRAQIPNLQPFTRYNVKVRAYTARGPGPYSTEVAFQTAAAQTAEAPPFVRVVNTGADNAHLVWQSPVNNPGYIDKYKCRYGVSGTQNYQEKQFPAVSPCQQRMLQRQQLPQTPPGARLHCGRIDNLQTDKTYDFQVAAHVRDGGWSPYSDTQTTKVTESAVEILSVNKIGGTHDSLIVAWNVRPDDRARVTGFKLMVTPLDGQSRAMTFNVDKNTYQYRIDNLRPRSQYNVTVQAATPREICYGTTATMWTDAAPLTGLAVAPRVIAEEATSITIEWDSRAREAGSFIVEYRLEGGAWQQHPRRVPAHPSQTTYTSTVDGLPTNKVVDLRVRVVSQQNEQSNPSPEVRARTKCSPPQSPPQGIRVDAPSTNEVRVSWSRIAKELWNCDQISTEISYRAGNGPEKILKVPGDQTEYTFPAEPNQRWVIKLRATNQVGSSQWSGEQSATTRQGAPGAVRDLRVKALSPNEVHVQWLAPLVQRGTIVGYDISYRLKHRLACPEEEPRDVSRDFVTVYNHKDLDYTITGLLPYSLYEVRVRARTTELGPEESKEVSTEQQPPSAPPLNLESTYTLERSLSFQWEPVECSQRHGHLVNYEYEIVGQDDWAKLERQTANTSDTKVTIEGLTPFTKYVMRVRAYNSIGGGPFTQELDVMTAKADAPLPPQDLVVAQEGTDFFMVSWLPPYPPYGPHDAYKIRYQLLGSDDWVTIEKGIKDPALQCPAESPRFCYNATGLESGQQYKVQVATRIEGGSYGPWSSVVIANTLQVLPDAPRAIHLVDKSDHHLHIRWIPPVDPKGHVIQYRVSIQSLDDINDKKRDFLVDHPTLTHLFDQLTPETSYNISISAGTKRGFGREIWTRYSTDPFVIPIVGTVPKVTPDGATALDVEWTAVADPKNRVKGYIIEIRNADTPVWQEVGGVTAHDPVKRTYLKKLTGLDPDTLYIIRIKVVDNKSRVGQPSPEAQGRTGCAPPSAPPSNVNVASPSNVQVRVSWQAPVKSSWLCSGIRYKLEYVNGTNVRKQIDLPSSSIEHLFDSPSNTKWTVRIRTENDAGASDWSKDLTLTTAEGAPGAVNDLTATPKGPTSAVVSWRPPSDPNGVITGYTLVYKLKSIGQCGPRSSTPIEKHVRSETQTLDGLLPDSTYEIHVIAHTSLAGPQSSVVTVTTEEAKPTGPPTNLRVGSITANRADVSWGQPDCEQRNGKITDYEYELESLDTWGENSTARHEQERLTLNDLVPYTEYRIRVRAQNSVGEGPFAEWVTFTTQSAAPPAPTDLQEEASFPHAIEISFLPPSPPHGEIDYYRVRHTPSGQLTYKEVRVEKDRLECSDANKRDRLCFRVTDLDPEQEYDIQVAAHTEGGAWSEWSDTLNARTQQQNIPVLERELEVVDTKPNSITLKWEGLPQDQAQHVVGYVLEFKSEDDDSEWAEYNGITKHRKGNNEYKITVKDLETATLYFFRLKVVGKNEKRGSPGPETKAMTSCGKPEEPPSGIKLESVDFETMKIIWTPPAEDSWKCDDVEFIIDYVNTTGRGQWTVSVDQPSELTVPTMPGTKWDIKMKTQTKEDGAKPQSSRWSDKVTLNTQSLPGELFVTVEPKGPKEALVTWDLPDKDQKWNYGVDITYKLKQLGGCTEAATGSQEPITQLNVQEKQIMLSDLVPGSTYEVIVTPRRPPSLHSSVATPKTVRTFKTANDIPTGAPQNLQSTSRKDSELGFKWEPPECAAQNGEISQYEWELVGLDSWNEGTRESVTPRLNTQIPDLQPGSLYRFKVRAYTAEGPGPWSEPLEIRTTGSELGPPREMTAVFTSHNLIQLTWLPPYPEKAVVTAYKLRYSPRVDDSNPTEVELSGDELSCSGYKSPLISEQNLCATVKGLLPLTTYRFSVQGRSTSGNWGEWSPDYFATTRSDSPEPMGGSLKLLSAGHDNLKVKWTPPDVIGQKIDRYDINISVASSLDENPSKYSVGKETKEHHFRHLKPVTQYNITVQGYHNGSKVWWINNIFSTTDFALGLLNWLPAPTDLHLIEKSDTMLHVDWEPPEIFDDELKELVTHYRVTIAPFDEQTGVTGTPKNYTVMVPGNSIKFEGLTPETVYNITVQAGTSSGYGHILWGTYSTLAPGQPHVLRLLNRTPTTLSVAWEPNWGKSHSGYILTAQTLHSVYPHVRVGQKKTFDVDAADTQYTIRGLNPSTVYNVTLKPRDHNDNAWGAYATLPPGWFTVKNLKQCEKTDFAVSFNWEPLDMAEQYQLRYMRLKTNEAVWVEEKPRSEVLCPSDPPQCDRNCYLTYNLEHKPAEYVFQIRVMVEGEWNHWKSAPRKIVSTTSKDGSPGCCIVPPPFFVKNIGAPKTWMDVDVIPPATQEYVKRTHIVVDERDPAGDTNWTQLTDKVSAKKKNSHFYVTASYVRETLTEPIKLRLGNGEVIGGFLNYPLDPNHKITYESFTYWNISNAPVYGRMRDQSFWWLRRVWWAYILPALFAFVLLGVLLALLCIYCRRRSRREFLSTTTNGQRVPLLDDDKAAMEGNLRQLEDRVSRLRGDMDTKAKGDFESGYTKGFKDANKLGSATEARRRMDEDYGARDDRFHEGYAKGLSDAGMAGMTKSMHNLAQRGGSAGGYSAGFMQGYKDGNAGIFGDRVTPSLISRLDEQYPGQDDFKQGFVDGFKEGVSSRTGERRTFEDSRRLQQSLTELTERLTSLEKTKGDEIHSTKIYHVYNQQPELGGMYTSSTGQQLATELEEQVNSASRRSTLRRHYTPGDYLKYASEGEGYNSLGRNRRSLSASALARESSEQRTTEQRSRHASGTMGSSYITRAAADRQGTDTFSKRYNYRSRSDVGSPRRYASQSLLDGSRPGPSTPHVRKDALHTLQKELDTLSRSPDRSTPRGYTSDTANVYDTVRSKARGYSNYDYDTYSSSRHEMRQSSSAQGGQPTAVRYPARRTETGAAAGGAGAADDNWADDLLGIVNEPMNKTLDRMKKYSSNANVEGGQSSQAGAGGETVEEKYHRTYKEEHNSSGR